MLMNLLHKYILKETLGTFLFGICIFTFIFLARQIFDMIDWIITKGVEPYKVLLLLLYITPSFIAITMPMAVLLSVILSFGRISSDNELTAMKSSGIDLKKLVTPVLLASLFISFALVIYNDQIRPRANYAFNNLIFEIGKERSSIILKDHQFINEFKGYVFYAEQQNKTTSTLHNILVYILEDNTNPFRIITAKSGKLEPDNNSRRIFLKLYDGTMHFMAQKTDTKYEQIFFSSYNIDLDINKEYGTYSGTNKDIKEMGILELNEYINRKCSAENAKSAYIEFHEKISLPFASFAFALIGIPLGMMVKRGGKTVGFGISLFLIFIYYLLFGLGTALASTNRLNPALSMWIPNIFITSIGLIFLRKINH